MIAMWLLLSAIGVWMVVATVFGERGSLPLLGLGLILALLGGSGLCAEAVLGLLR